MLLYYRLISGHRSLITNPGRGGRAVDRAGLEIRFEDFDLNWTRFASNGLFSQALRLSG
jgi:hypothetical protein